MSQQHPAVSNQPLDRRSTANWHAFTRTITYAACIIFAVLALMALFLT